MVKVNNFSLASLFRQMATALLLLDEKKNYFRILAYRKAAEIIESLDGELFDLWKEKKEIKLPGFGKTMRAHAEEFFTKGRVQELEETIKQIPSAVYLLQNIRGVGPKTAMVIVSHLGFNSRKKEPDKVVIDKIIQACKEKKIEKIPGFGEKSQEEILRAVQKFQQGLKKEKRILLADGIRTAEKIIRFMKLNPKVQEIEMLGSLRRKCETVGDVDLAVSTTDAKSVIEHFCRFSHETLLEQGETKAAFELANGTRVDLRISDPSQWGTMLAHFTGSKEHNVALREYALKKNLSVSEYGIKKNNKLITFKTENEFYHFLGLQFIDPELRENRGEIKMSIENRLPDLIELGDVKGDLHVHSDFDLETSHDLGESSGNSLIQMALDLGYEYLAFTDHNPSLARHTSLQIVEILQRRKEYIQKLNDKWQGKIHVFNSLEVDILPSGELAISIEALNCLDFVIASVHSSFDQTREFQTKRLLAALDQPKVKILGHPTGRKILRRDPIAFDENAVFEKCRKNRIAIEISACPDRLDLPWKTLADLKNKNIFFIINTDSHQVRSLETMKFGVWQARKAGLTKKDILNTISLVEIKKFLL